MKPTTRLREMLRGDRMIVAPGAYDALSAKIIEQAGFEVVYMTGAGVSRSLGFPDVGLATLGEMTERAAQITTAVNVPVLADADTGYGNAINVIRTVREYERAGLAGLHLEDQDTPKRCGHYEGKGLISVDEMIGKLQAALDARRDPDFVIIARTDACGVDGIDAAIERANRYAETGVDAVFVAAPRSREELARIASEVSAPVMMNMFEGGKTPYTTNAEFERMGFRLVIFSAAAQMAACWAIAEVMRVLRRDGSLAAFADHLMSFKDRDALIGLPETEALEARYIPQA
jgi:carboxyvinyl-carboxyphosphonate phosphorylmutase